MGTTTAQGVINAASRLLYDVPQIKWPASELLGYVNAAQRMISLIQPNSVNTIAVVNLVAGARQTLPLTAWMLLDIICNMGTGGTTPGQVPRPISRRLIDAFNPTWQAGTQSSTVKSYIFDEQDQTAYFVFPPNDGTGTLKLNYASIPAPITDPTSTLQVTDVLQSAVLNYVMFRACSKNAPFAAGPAVAGAYLELFNQQLGAKTSAESANDPNLALYPSIPAQEGGES